MHLPLYLYVNSKWAEAEIKKAEAKVKVVIQKKERQSRLARELSTIKDVIEQNPANVLPRAIKEYKAPPSLSERFAVHAGVMRVVMEKLKQIEGDVGYINPKTRDEETRDLIFEVLFLVSESVLPQRTSPWVTSTYGVPRLFDDVDDDLGIDTDKLKKHPCFVCWRDSVGQYGLCQLRTKTGISPWMPIPRQMTELLGLYLELLHAGYRELSLIHI